ncbi:MAG TPA: hypothetical protein VFT98_23340 [Myxococcota bacterium]|nr:hypothetical protein [Myxococcota bacterium]
MIRRARAVAWLFLLGAAACLGCAGLRADGSVGTEPSEVAPLPRGYLPFVWPRDGVVSLLACRFETARPIGVISEGASAGEGTALTLVLRALERGGLGVRFIEAPREHAQIQVAFVDEATVAGAAAAALGAHSVVDCRLAASDGEVRSAEIASARIEIARNVAMAGGAPRPLAREELLGVLARELGRALGWAGAAPARDPVATRTLALARRVGGELRDGAALESPALRALYARASGSAIARVPEETPLATRPLDRLASLAAARGLDGPYLRTSDDAGRVFWRDVASGDEYGAQIVAPARLARAPGRIALALEPRARRALPRSGDAAP